jgi:hypothetical protein
MGAGEARVFSLSPMRVKGSPLVPVRVDHARRVVFASVDQGIRETKCAARGLAMDEMALVVLITPQG